MKYLKFLLSLVLFFFCFSHLSASENPEDKLVKNAAYQAVLNEHVATLKNLSTANSPKFVLFSGAPGMGKTTLAKRIEDELHALRISTDEIRTILKKYGMNADAKIAGTQMTYLSGYLVNLAYWIEKNSPNKLWVIDASMDKNYDEMVNFAKLKKAPTFLVRLVTSKETALARLKTIPEADFYLPQFEGWWAAYTTFNKPIDYTFDNSQGQVFGNIAPLTSAIINKK